MWAAIVCIATAIAACVFNRVQENLLVGGLSRWAASGRLTRTLRITATREDVRLNGRLWDLATEALAA